MSKIVEKNSEEAEEGLNDESEEEMRKNEMRNMKNQMPKRMLPRKNQMTNV